MAGSFGAVFKITVSTTLTAVTKMLDVTWPKQVAETADNTPHDATSGYRTFLKTGVFELQPHQVTLEWLDTEATHAAILTALASTDAVACSIEDADGNEVIAYDAHIVGLDRVTALSDVFKGVVDVRPTGEPTIT